MPLQRSPTLRGPAPIRSANAGSSITSSSASSPAKARFSNGGAMGRATSHGLRPGSTITPIIQRQHPLGGPGKPDVFGAQPSAPPFDIAAP